MVLTQKKLFFFTLILLILYSNTINTISQGTSIIIDGDLSDWDGLELNSDDPIIIITRANYRSDSHQIQLKYTLSFQQNATIVTSTGVLFYYSIRASSNVSWYIPMCAILVVLSLSFEKGTYSYVENLTLDIENSIHKPNDIDESIFKPQYIDIEVGLYRSSLNASDSCRITEEDNYSIIHDIQNYPQFTPGFSSWLLFTSFISLVIIQKKQRKKVI